ncbi:DUF1428 family protein [Cypionkella sp.]|uniref:DUF1428 family protein n=1 Tax=Cypionkella sp. TaxID=2811411 RepID=UPI00345A7109
MIQVPTDRNEDYREMAKQASIMFRSFGALEMLEGREEDMRDGKVADFRRAVQAKDGEAIAFS